MNSTRSLDRHDPGDLPGHAIWLRRLARALAQDEASADDLVQDAFGAALTSRRPIRDLRAFLGGVVRRRSSEVRRRELRRRLREESFAASRETVLPGAAESAERVETMRILLEELQRLPAAQRDALTLRYVDGLEPADIARRASLSPATVRAHVSRGLAALRERLDRRSGGRASWTAAFAPWIGPAAPLSTAGSETGTAVEDVPRTDPTGVPGVALPGALTMSLKIVAAALVPLSLLGAWLALERSDPSTSARDALGEARAGKDGSAPAHVARVAPDPVAAAGDERTALGIEDVPGITQHRVAGRVVDELTGELVPAMELWLRFLPDPLDARGATAGTGHGGDAEALDESRTAVPGPLGEPASDVVRIETDGDGSFAAGEERPAGPVVVVSPHGREGASTDQRVTRRAFPFDGPIPVRIGPTFRFATELPGDLPESSFVARFVPERGAGSRPPETVLRVGVLPWARFPFAVTRLEGEGPWTVEVSDEEGLWLAEATVARTVGIEPLPVPLDFRALGAIELVVSRDDGARCPLQLVDVENVASGESRRVFLERDQPRSARGRARFLEPGTYHWTAGPEEGEAEVVAGEVTEVVIELSYRGATFDATVELDASAVRDEDVRNSRFAVVDVNDYASSFPVEPRRDEGDPAGRWRFVLEDLPAGTWSLVPANGFAPVRWRPERVLLEEGGAPGILVALPRGAPVPVHLTVRDAVTGEPIPGAEAAWNTGGVAYVVGTADDAGGVTSPGVPDDEESHVLVRAPGHRLTCARVVPIEDGHDVEVRLERGWRGLVRVMRTDDFSLVGGVEVVVDGTSAGFTDENGLVWIDGESPPLLVELGEGAPTVVMSPFDPPGTFPADPLLGWTFLVRAP